MTGWSVHKCRRHPSIAACAIGAAIGITLGNLVVPSTEERIASGSYLVTTQGASPSAVVETEWTGDDDPTASPRPTPQPSTPGEDAATSRHTEHHDGGNGETQPDESNDSGTGTREDAGAEEREDTEAETGDDDTSAEDPPGRNGPGDPSDTDQPEPPTEETDEPEPPEKSDPPVSSTPTPTPTLKTPTPTSTPTPTPTPTPTSDRERRCLELDLSLLELLLCLGR